MGNFSMGGYSGSYYYPPTGNFGTTWDALLLTAAEKTRVSNTRLGYLVDTGATVGGLTVWPPTTFGSWDDVLLTANEKSRVGSLGTLVGTTGTTVPSAQFQWNAGSNAFLTAAEKTRIAALDWVPSSAPSLTAATWDAVLATAAEKTRVSSKDTNE